MAYEICRVTFAICGSECGKIVTSTILYKGTCTEISFSLQHDQGEDEVILLMKQLSYKPTSPWWWWVFSSSAVSNSLQPCGLQHVRLPCPSPSSRVCSNSRPWSQWCRPPISKVDGTCSGERLGFFLSTQLHATSLVLFIYLLPLNLSLPFLSTSFDPFLVLQTQNISTD